MTAKHVDRALTPRPIVITHANGNLMNVNTAMLRLARIGVSTDVEGVVKFPDGAPSGKLQERATMFLMQRKIGKVGFAASLAESGCEHSSHRRWRDAAPLQRVMEILTAAIMSSKTTTVTFSRVGSTGRVCRCKSGVCVNYCAGCRPECCG